MKVINLDERRKMRILVSMPDEHTIGLSLYYGPREPDRVWEDDEGRHVVVLSRSQPEAMIYGVEKIRAFEATQTVS